MSQKKRKKGEDPSSVWLQRSSTYHFFSAGAQVTALHHPKNVPLADNSLGAGHGCWTRGYGWSRWAQIPHLGSSLWGQTKGHPCTAFQTPPSLQEEEHWGHHLLGQYPCCLIPDCNFSLWPEEMDLAGAGRAEEMLFIFQKRTACSTNPEIPKPVKALSRPSWPWALLRFPGLNKKVLLLSKE